MWRMDENVDDTNSSIQTHKRMEGSKMLEEETPANKEGLIEVTLDSTSEETSRARDGSIDGKTEGASPLAKLEEELEALRLKIRHYEEPPDFDLNEYTISVNGIQRTKSSLLGVGGHVRYCILVKNPQVKSALKVFRRFSDWVVLSQILENEVPLSLLPQRPPKKLGILGRNMDSDFVEHRMLQLHAYTQCLARNPSVRHNQAFRKFLYLPSEQWEELIGNVTSLGTSLPKIGDASRARQDVAQNLWKGIEETGMSLLGSFGMFGASANVSSKPPGANAEAAQRFCKVYNKYMYVNVSSDTERINEESPQQKQQRRAEILGNATGSVLKLIRTVKGKCSESEQLAVSLERLSMDEGTQLGQDCFTMLNAFSAALHDSFEADKRLLSSVSKRSSMAISEQTLVQALQQHTFIAEGGDRLYSEVFKDEAAVRSNDDFETTLIPEIQRAQSERVTCLSAALQPFVEEQIQNARDKVKAYNVVLEALRQA